MTDILVEFEQLTLLDSPLLPMLAPELLPMRDEVLELFRQKEEGCTPCQQRARVAKLAEIHIRLQNSIANSHDLQSVIPQLAASAKAKAS